MLSMVPLNHIMTPTARCAWGAEIKTSRDWLGWLGGALGRLLLVTNACSTSPSCSSACFSHTGDVVAVSDFVLRSDYPRQ